MKTALQQLIEQFEKAKDQADKKADFIGVADFSYAIEQAETLLQTEREQIEKACLYGSSCPNGILESEAEEYYDKTYGDESTSGDSVVKKFFTTDNTSVDGDEDFDNASVDRKTQQ